jgi:WhiB family transcriptional regulator, redox-sensing transcriptional regulator
VSARQVLADLDGWVLRAVCRSGPSDRVFFPSGKTGAPIQGKHKAAKRLCADCPVAEPCLLRAMPAEGNSAAESRYGVFGGLDPDERHALHLEQTHAHCPST